MITASTDIRYLKGVGEKRAVVLKDKGIDTVGALLRYYPRDYLDWTDIKKISSAPLFEKVCIKAKVLRVDAEQKRNGMTLYSVYCEDDTAQMTAVLFNQRFLAESLREGREYLFYGRLLGGFLCHKMSSPKIVPVSNNAIEPIYPASKDLSSKQIKNLIKTAIGLVKLPETLNEEIRQRNKLCSLGFALQNIHFPLNREAFLAAQKRLVFEELFVLRTGLGLLKTAEGKKTGYVIKQGYLSDFKELLSFEMTSAQERVIKECMRDMFSGYSMNRLVQGDVGSGKTVVAAALMYSAAKNGFQSAMMVPTEILAAQHYKTLLKLTEKTGIKCALLTSSVKKKEKDQIKTALKNGEIDVIVGTHSLINRDVEFNKLGLVVTDEQHRFGVNQRGDLSLKGENPHTLVMSATPIPGTLGLILYGDLDISVVDEYPAGRQKIDTYLVDSSYRPRIYNYIKKFLNEGRQGYIVCPLVSEVEEVDIISAKEYYVNLKEGEFKGYNIGLLHGKMSSKEKDQIMLKFSEGEIQLLVATTVIEVGIDVPNAVIMVIENAERFGLSALHQLRGRIGRGEYESDCILITDNTSEDTQKRLEVIKNTTDGFLIADEDLKLRGPGDFLGSRQHGLPAMKIADLFADRDILELAGKEAKILLQKDPDLSLDENLNLKAEIIELYKKLNEE